MEMFQQMAVALGIGLLIGLERGWRGREAGEGQRVAGFRTFGLISLFGAMSAILADSFGAIVLGLAFIGLAALTVAAQMLRSAPQRDYGITTTVAAMLTFALGAAAAAGHTEISVAVAVVTALLLGLKVEIHAWLSRLQKQELLAALKLLVISVVLLPVLPDAGFGPWETLNPYRIWWLVVLITSMGFVGYFTMKLAGARLGIMLTGIAGGLASSTALTLSFSRLGRHNARAHTMLVAGIVMAAATVFPRVILEVSVVNPSLLPAVMPAMLSMALIALAAALWLWRAGHGDETDQPALQLPNPFELVPALKFALLLAAILLASRAATEWFGTGGVYLLTVISGVADVDAITLSLANLARDQLDANTAARAIVLAAITNTVAKGVLVAFIGGAAMGKRVALAFAAVIATGTLAMASGSMLW